MKRLCAVLLCLLLAGLCACEEIEPEETSEAQTTTAAAATSAATAPVSYPYVQLEPTEIKTDKSDPYSYVIRAYYELERSLFQKAGKELVQGFQELPSDEGSAFETIKYNVSSEGQLLYALYDINGDGVEELLISGRHVNSSLYYPELLSIYTIQNGVAVQQFQRVPIESIVLYDNGTVASYSGRQGVYNDSYYRFKNGRFVFCETVNYATSINNDDEEVFVENESEYRRLLKKYVGSAERVNIDHLWQPLWPYKKAYTGYREAYKEVLSLYAEEIQNYEGGTYTALVTTNDLGAPELVFIAEFPQIEENEFTVIEYVWKFINGKPLNVWQWAYYPMQHGFLERNELFDECIHISELLDMLD